MSSSSPNPQVKSQDEETEYDDDDFEDPSDEDNAPEPKTSETYGSVAISFLEKLKKVVEMYKQYQDGNEKSKSQILFKKGTEIGFKSRDQFKQVNTRLSKQKSVPLKENYKVDERGWSLEEYITDISKLQDQLRSILLISNSKPFHLDESQKKYYNRDFLGVNKKYLDLENERYLKIYHNIDISGIIKSIDPQYLYITLQELYKQYQLVYDRQIFENINKDDPNDDNPNYVLINDERNNGFFIRNQVLYDEVKTKIVKLENKTLKPEKEILEYVYLTIYHCYMACVKYLIFQDVQFRLFQDVVDESYLLEEQDEQEKKKLANILKTIDKHRQSNGYIYDILQCNYVYLNLFDEITSVMEPPKTQAQEAQALVQNAKEQADKEIYKEEEPPAQVKPLAQTKTPQLPITKLSPQKPVKPRVQSAPLKELQPFNVILRFTGDVPSQFLPNKTPTNPPSPYFGISKSDNDDSPLEQIINAFNEDNSQINKHIVIINSGKNVVHGTKYQCLNKIVTAISKLSPKLLKFFELRVDDYFQILEENLNDIRDYSVNRMPLIQNAKDINIKILNFCELLETPKERTGHVFLQYKVGNSTLTIIDIMDNSTVFEVKDALCKEYLQLINKGQSLCPKDLTPYVLLNHFMINSETRFAIPLPPVTVRYENMLEEKRLKQDILINKFYQQSLAFERITQSIYNHFCLNEIFNLVLDDKRFVQLTPKTKLEAIKPGETFSFIKEKTDTSKTLIENYKLILTNIKVLKKYLDEVKSYYDNNLKTFFTNYNKYLSKQRRQQWGVVFNNKVLRIESVHIHKNNLLQSATDLQKYAEEFLNVPVNIRDATGPFNRPLSKYYNELDNEKLKTLKSIQQIDPISENIEKTLLSQQKANDISIIKCIKHIVGNDPAVKYVFIGNFTNENEYDKARESKTVPIFYEGTWTL